MGVLEIVGSLFLAAGCVLALTGSIGVLRMPDFYSRLHPAGKSDTLAQALILIGLALFAGQQMLEVVLAGRAGEHGGAELIGLANIMLKLVLLSALLFVTAPTATHAIAKAARLDRFTRIRVEEDPGASRVGDIVVAGDVGEQLQEEPGPVLDVHDDEPGADADADAPPSSHDTQSEDD
ncbi:MAG TPA: monovalent cation/H(+) antiporter subunit G [Enhygromyxa sp.]|nr:monovalent cation/H(+) antiporter subunit G [Enhygromyxa sp.]